MKNVVLLGPGPALDPRGATQAPLSPGSGPPVPSVILEALDLSSFSPALPGKAAF